MNKKPDVRHTEPLEQPLIKKGLHVPPKLKNPSEALYEARKAKLREVCSKYGVLINDGWNFASDEFYDELAKVK